jgi:vancomycin permeability regulator SanA
MFALCNACLTNAAHKIYKIQDCPYKGIALCMGGEKYTEAGYQEVFWQANT